MWRNLSARLQQELGLLPRDSFTWEQTWMQAPSLDKLYNAFAAMERECAREVDNAIRQWSYGGMLRWPALTPKASMMLRVRLEAAEQLLHLLMLRQSQTIAQPFTSREADMPLLARRLLITWWKDKGHESGGDLWVAKQWQRLHQEAAPGSEPRFQEFPMKTRPTGPSVAYGLAAY